MASLTNYFAKILKDNAANNELMMESDQKLKSDSDAGNPNKAWKKRLKRRKCSSVKPVDPSTPVKEDHVRFVCISDTHTKLEQFKNLEIPNGDVLLHAGDFSMFGQPDEVDVVNKYLRTLPHKHKVIIAGNHDITFDLDLVKIKRSTRIWSLTEDNFESRLEHFGVETVPEMLTDCTYLQDSMTELYGIKIYGSPWTPGKGFWGFQRLRGQGLMKKWNQIPPDTDILLTHCPPCGFGDNVKGISHTLKRLAGAFSEDHVGCVDLLNTVQTRVKPKYHVFGHIHEGYGVQTDGITTYINASTCTDTYDPKNQPIVFDFPLPEGYSKTGEDRQANRNKDICTKSEHCDTDEANCDKVTDLQENSETESYIQTDNQSSHDDKMSNSINGDIGNDTAEVEFSDEIDWSGSLDSVQEDPEDDSDSVDDDMFVNISGYSADNSVSNGNTDWNKSDDNDDDDEIDIVFDSELDLDSGGKDTKTEKE